MRFPTPVFEAGVSFLLYHVQLDSLTKVTDEDRNIVSHVCYDASGCILENTILPTFTNRLYTGSIYDADTGLYKIGARWYDPAIGVWLTPDSIVPGLEPMAWNRYAFNYQNPANYVDPSGHWAESAVDAVGFGMSLRDFWRKPSLGNAFWLGLDAVGLALPIVTFAWARRADQAVGLVTHGDEVVQVALHGDEAASILNRSYNFGEMPDEEVEFLRRLSAENDTAFIITGSRAETTVGRQNRELALRMKKGGYGPDEIFAKTGVAEWRNKLPTGKLELDYFTPSGQGGLPRRARRSLHRHYDTAFDAIELDNWARFRRSYGHRAPGGIVFDRGRVYRNHLEPWQYAGVLSP